MLSRALGALIVIALLCGAGSAPIPMDMEGPGITVDLFPLDSMVAGHGLDVGVVISGSLGENAVAHAQVMTDGLQLAGGDSSFSVPLVGLVPMHRLHLKAKGSGQHVLRVRVTVVQGGKERALAEVALAVRVDGDTLAAGRRSFFRSEFVEGDQRYRVSGLWWVPIDAPEEVNSSDLFAETAKPVIVSQKAATCSDCGESTKPVRVMVVVDRSGAVRHVQAFGERSAGIAADSAQAAASRWRFAPARIGRTPVTDCLIVSVPISR